MTKSKPLDDLIKIEDELRDDFKDFKTVYFDADKHKGEVDLVKFSYALAKLDFDLDILSNLIDQLQTNTANVE